MQLIKFFLAWFYCFETFLYNRCILCVELLFLYGKNATILFPELFVLLYDMGFLTVSFRALY